ncbi:Hypothetical protein PBC10988_19570 [Planctomycetales bacterium 10988]|nr:Hypothetical protein PBC10988_19570 [Planctomycetales bacterium 10988]
MGLDASVMCNCFQKGKTTPPPVLREWLEIDVEGYLNLKKEHDSDEDYMKLSKWSADCCPHPGLYQAQERIGNWASISMLKMALGKVGWEYFPVIDQELPQGNGGITKPSQSAKALRELAFFERQGVIGKTTVLVDSTTGKELRKRVPSHNGIFLLNGSQKTDAGIGEFTFFVRDRETNAELFNAPHVRQFSKNGKPITDQNKTVIWEDPETGQQVESTMLVGGEPKKNLLGQTYYEFPAEFHVELRNQTAEDFRPVTDSLEAVFSASVQTGNPVRWC